MRKVKLFACLFTVFLSSAANAQYSADSPESPWFGGPGNYEYPMVCGECTVWQDYRNFAWNQLTINGGDAHTPTNPGNHTAFRIYTDTDDDMFSVTVEITLEIVDVEIMGHEIGHDIVDPAHYIVETHPENGDTVDAGFYPANQGPLLFPYEPLDDENDGSGSGGGSSPGGSDGGGDSSSGGSGGGWGGGGGGAGAGGGGGGWNGGGGGYCGPGTEWHCVQL